VINGPIPFAVFKGIGREAMRRSYFPAACNWLQTLAPSVLSRQRLQTLGKNHQDYCTLSILILALLKLAYKISLK
jgi:hypothetical protein